MYNGLLPTHSGLRWIALILLIVAILNALMSKGKNSYVKKDKMINLFTMISLHTQLLIGLVLYFLNDKHKISFQKGWMSSDLAGGMYRFFGMEHLVGMILAIVIITIGRKKAEKAATNDLKHTKILTWYTIGLILILAFIPWPFREALGGAWF